MGDFKWRHFRGEIILWAVRWYCKYGISYRELEEMMTERGNAVDHTTIFRWVQRYAPEMEKRLKWYLRSSLHQSWRVDETYVKVKGQWVYLYRAVDKATETWRFVDLCQYLGVRTRIGIPGRLLRFSKECALGVRSPRRGGECVWPEMSDDERISL